MNDPYEKAWESIGKALSTQSKMVLWIAERTLSAKDFMEFVDEFAKNPKDNYDELLENKISYQKGQIEALIRREQTQTNAKSNALDVR